MTKYIYIASNQPYLKGALLAIEPDSEWSAAPTRLLKQHE